MRAYYIVSALINRVYLSQKEIDIDLDHFRDSTHLRIRRPRLGSLS